MVNITKPWGSNKIATLKLNCHLGEQQPHHSWNTFKYLNKRSDAIGEVFRKNQKELDKYTVTLNDCFTSLLVKLLIKS